MPRTVSLTINILLIMSRLAKIMDAKRNINEIKSNCIVFGLIIIIIPINPKNVAIHLCGVIFSFKANDPIINVKIGIVKLIVVATATFTYLTPYIQQAIPIKNSKPLIIWISYLLVCNEDLCKKITGTNVKVVNKNLKNATFIGGILKHICFAKMSFIAPQIMLKIK